MVNPETPDFYGPYVAGEQMRFPHRSPAYDDAPAHLEVGDYYVRIAQRPPSRHSQHAHFVLNFLMYQEDGAATKDEILDTNIMEANKPISRSTGLTTVVSGLVEHMGGQGVILDKDRVGRRVRFRIRDDLVVVRTDDNLLGDRKLILPGAQIERGAPKTSDARDGESRDTFRRRQVRTVGASDRRPEEIRDELDGKISRYLANGKGVNLLGLTMQEIDLAKRVLRTKFNGLSSDDERGRFAELSHDLAAQTEAILKIHRARA